MVNTIHILFIPATHSLIERDKSSAPSGDIVSHIEYYNDNLYVVN